MRRAYALVARIAFLAAVVVVFASLLVTPTSATLPPKLFVVCKYPKNLVCLSWHINPEEVAKASREFYKSDDSNCGLSDLKLLSPHRKFIAVKPFNEPTTRKIYCKAKYLKAADELNWFDDDKHVRMRRNTGYHPRGRYRGQTQSQYLSIDHGNGKDEGKAEAHSAADSSRAIVSGNSGMGQAQSQTVYDPSCDDCLGRSDLDAANLSYKPSHFPSSGTNYDISQQQQPDRNIDTNHHVNGQFNRPGNLAGQQQPQGRIPDGSHTGSGGNDPGRNYNGIHQPNNQINQLTSPGGLYNKPGNSMAINRSPDGTFDQTGTPQQIPSGTNRGINPQIPPGGHVNQEGSPGYGMKIHPLQSGKPDYTNMPNSNTFPPGSTGQTNQPNSPIITNPAYGNNGRYDVNHPNTPSNYFNNYPGGMNEPQGARNGMVNQPNGQGHMRPPQIPNGGYSIDQAGIPNPNIPQGGIINGNKIPGTQGNYNNGNRPIPQTIGLTSNQPGTSMQPGLSYINYPLYKSGTNYPVSEDGSRRQTFNVQSNGLNWPLLSSLLPAGGAGSTYFCCVVSPGIQQESNNPYANSNGYTGTGPYNTGTSQPGNVGQNVPFVNNNGFVGQSIPQTSGNLGQNAIPDFKGPHSSGQNTMTNVPYGTGNIIQNIPNGSGRPEQILGTNKNSQILPYDQGNTGPNGAYGTANIMPSINGPYTPGSVGQNVAYRPGTTGLSSITSSNGPHGPANTYRPYGPGNGQNVLPSQNGPYDTSHTSPNGGYGSAPSVPFSPGNTGQSGAYGPKTPGQNVMTPINGPYGQGNIGQNGAYGPGITGQNGAYGPGNTGQNAAYEPGTTGQNAGYGPGTTGQTGSYGPGTTGQNEPYGPGTTGQNAAYGPETTGQSGSYGPGTTGQNSVYGPGTTGQTGSYGLGTTGQTAAYGPGTTGQTGSYGPGATGQTGSYGPGTTGQNAVYGPGTTGHNAAYGPGTTGQTGSYGPGTTGQNTAYGPGTTGQNAAYGPGTTGLNAAYGPGTTGQTGSYGPGSTGQNAAFGPGTAGPTGSYGPGTTGQNAVNGPGTTGQNTLTSLNGSYGLGNVGQNGAYQPGISNGPFGPENTVYNRPYGPGTAGQNAMTSPNGIYTPSNFGANGAYGPGTSGQNTITSSNGPHATGNTGQLPFSPDNINSNGGAKGPLGTEGFLQYPNSPYGSGITATNSGQNNLQYPNGPYGTGNTGQNNYQPSINNNGSPGPQVNGFNNLNGGIPQNVLDPNSITSTLDDYDSEAQASVTQAINGTNALASSKGGNKNGQAQTQVEGTYTGTGSFSANAEISDESKAAQSHVSGSKKGASSSAEGRGRKNKSQASVKLGSETGSILTDSQSSGNMHSSTSQVQGSVKGGMADAQAKGPGSTSSQAQIGFTPYKKEEKEAHDALKMPFQGGGTASAQTSGRIGTSQSQLRGTFKYGITYNGAAQAGSSLDKDAVFSNLIPFDKIDVYDENNKNIDINDPTTEEPQETTVLLTENDDDISSTINYSNTLPDLSDHDHSDHHKSNEQQNTTTRPPPEGNRRSFQSKYGTNTAGDYEYVTDKDDVQQEDYDIDDGYGGDGKTENGQTEYTNYDDLNRDTEKVHQSLQASNKKGIEVRQTTGGNTQHIILGALQNHDAKIIQKNSEHPDEGKIYQPGEKVPGMGGYTIPVGFTGSVKSVASKEKTYVVGSKSSPSQAQTVTLTPGSGKVKYVYPNYYGKNVNSKDLRSLYNTKPDENRYLSVSKSVTRDLDNDDNIRRQYSHTYYTKSSSCGYFTFTCTMVSSAEGKKKVCRPKIPTNPDGTPMRC